MKKSMLLVKAAAHLATQVNPFTLDQPFTSGNIPQSL